MKFSNLIRISILSFALATTAIAQPNGALFQKEIVYFDFDKEYPIAKSIQNIEKIAKLLEERPNLSIRIIGYADPEGDETYNLNLSKRRAEACQKALIELCIEPQRILIEAKGEESIHEIADNLHHERRRVEMIPILLKN